MTSSALSTKSGKVRSDLGRVVKKGLVELTYKSSYNYNKENQMKNLNSPKIQPNINFNSSIRSKLDEMLAVCENFNTDISHVYLTENEACRLMRNISMSQYYQFRFNDLGIELVCPDFKKRTQ